MFCRWRTITAAPAAAVKSTVAHGSPRTRQQERQRHRRHERGERGVAEEHERREPDDEADRARRAGRARAPRRRPSRPSCRPCVNPSQIGRAWPSIAAAPGEHADPLTAELEPTQRRHEALGDVEQRHRHAEPAPVGAPHVRGADVAAALLADVLAAEDPDDDDAEGDRPDQVAPGDDQGVLEHEAPQAGGMR